MKYFPNGDEEKELIKFVAQYQYLNVNDEKYFFSSRKYYKERIKKLIDKKYLRRNKLNLVLGTWGKEYAKSFEWVYNKTNTNQKYKERLIRLSHLGAFYHNCETVKFTPSFAVKDKESFTIIGRRYMGVLNYEGIKYLAYQITKDHNRQYISSLLFDIQKEVQHTNFVVLVHDMKVKDKYDFGFGHNHMLIVEDTEENREKLKYIHRIRWLDIIKDYYDGKVYMSSYNFCDYMDYDKKFVSTFYMYDQEKVNRIRGFLDVNENRQADIICSSELVGKLRKEIPEANYCIVNFEKYIRKHIRYYYVNDCDKENSDSD